MGTIRVYLKPFLSDGSGYASDWTEVTDRVAKIGDIEIDTDSQEFQLGVFKNSSVSITLDNRNGEFTDVGNTQSIFVYKRADTQCKVTWLQAAELPRAGWVTVPFYVAEEKTLFEGLLSDDTFAENAKTEQVEFRILGFEKLFDDALVPFSDLSVGQSIAEMIYTCLNQTSITGLLTVTQGNITPDTDQDPDVIDFMENKPVSEILDLLLLVSNSVLWITDRTVYVGPRDPSASLIYTFYGQASIVGIENIIDVKDIRTGINRVFNQLTWADSTAVQKDTTSIALNGLHTKEISFEAFTDVSKQNTLLLALVTEFATKKKELTLTARLNDETQALVLLDKVNVDYPTVFTATPGYELPICGIAVCGEAVLPKGLWSLTLDTSTYFKILRKTISPSKQTVTFKLREI